MAVFDWNNFGIDERFEKENASSPSEISAEGKITSVNIEEGYFDQLNKRINDAANEKTVATTQKKSDNVIDFSNFTAKKAKEEPALQVKPVQSYGVTIWGQLLYIAIVAILTFFIYNEYEEYHTYSGIVVEERNEKNAGQSLLSYDYYIKDGHIRKLIEKNGDTVILINEYDEQGNQTFSGKPEDKNK